MADSISRKRCQESFLSPPPVKKRAYERFSKLVAMDRIFNQLPGSTSHWPTKSVPSNIMTPELEDNNPIHSVINKRTSRELFAVIPSKQPNVRKVTRSKENTCRSPAAAKKPSHMSSPPRDKKKSGITNSLPLRDLSSRRSTKGPKQKLETIKERLHVSAVMESLPCREKEISDIISFVRGKLICNGSGCMYISGVPGTGKTATVREVSKRLQSMVETGDIPKFQFIEINGLRLTEPRQAYVEILKQLKGEKTTADKAAAILNDYFCSGRRNKRKQTIVLLADELDLLWTRKQSILYNLFDWPSHSNAKLIVLAIANTMNLPERLMMGRVSSRMGLTRLDFHPYTFNQLKEIINKRLTSSKIFESDAIEYASRKVASVSGDARRALDICRRAVEIAGRDCKKGTYQVTMANVMAAIEEMFTSPRVTAIKNCSQFQKMFIRALLASLKSSNLEETTLKQVFSLLVIMCKEEGVPVISVTQGTSICTRLVSMNLILLESGQGYSGIHRRVRLNVTQDDVHYALMHKRTNC